MTNDVASEIQLLRMAQDALAQGELVQAEASVRGFLDKMSGSVEGLVTWAHILREKGALEQSVRLYQTILRARPQHVAATTGLAASLFLLERWPQAWQAFDVRFQLMDDPPKVTKKNADGQVVEVPIWTGGAVPSRLLVMAEQGLGDTLQFARFLPDLAEQGADVHFVVEPKLQRLLCSQPCSIQYRARGVAGRVEGIKAWAPLMGLARALAVEPTCFMRKGGYLRAEPELVRRWGERLPSAGYRIGIAWQGNPDPRIDKGRSLPLLAFAPLAALEGVQLVSLQKGVGTEQIAQVPFRNRILTLPDLDEGEDAFVDTAAVMSHLDLIVTVDTALGHLAGALDRPSFILLKACGADWRWLARPTDTVWYERTQLIRQTKQGDWADVVQRLVHKIQSDLSRKTA